MMKKCAGNEDATTSIKALKCSFRGPGKWYKMRSSNPPTSIGSCYTNHLHGSEVTKLFKMKENIYTLVFIN
jgi:hypothetical protein